MKIKAYPAERRASRQARVENDELAYKARKQETKDYLAAARTADDSRICKTVQASNASGRSAAAVSYTHLTLPTKA